MGGFLDRRNQEYPKISYQFETQSNLDRNVSFMFFQDV